MTKEQKNGKIIEIVKKAIADNTVVRNGEDDIIALDCNDVDHIAEEVAEAVCHRIHFLENRLDEKCDRCIERDRKEGAKFFAEKLKKVIHERDYIQGYAEIGLIEEIDELLKEYE